jgi:glycosyltransferase involved in cell wall biosynthesis
MVLLSAVILAKNEESMIADCIDSLSFCDEIIVVDDLSEDRTAEIAEKMRARVYSLKEESFDKKRSFGMQKAKGSWVLYIDADERVDDLLRKNIQSQISNAGNKRIVAYTLKRKNYYLGNHEWPVIETLDRLFRKKAFKEWKGVLHETAYYEGEKAELDGFLLHYTHRDLHSMLEKTIQWSSLEAKLRYEAHHPKMSWWRFPRVMFTAFYDSYIKQKGYTVGTVGLIESMFQAFSIFVTYARLWELQNTDKNIDSKT